MERWIPAAPDIHERLISSSSRVADVGCGAGWSTVALSRAFPRAEVIGFDADEASIIDARQHAAAQGVSARFEVCDAVDIGGQETFDLVLVLEALHDISHPSDALRAIRQALKPGGAVLVADEKVAERFHAPGDEIERPFFVTRGRVFPEGAIQGDGADFNPNRSGHIGVWICRGTHLVAASEIPDAQWWVSTAQLFVLGRQGREQLTTEGIEGRGTITRIVTGGAGNYAGWVGEQHQTFLGFNSTGGVNLRVTFVLRPPAR